MQKKLFVALSIAAAIGIASAAAWPTEGDKDKPAAGVGKLPENWSENVTVKDLTEEINESATRMGQNLKKASDFDKFLKNINTEGHLAAVLAALLHEHTDAGNWKGVAAQIQTQSLDIAKAAEVKGGKNFKTAQEAHKKIAALRAAGIAVAESPAEIGQTVLQAIQSHKGRSKSA